MNKENQNLNEGLDLKKLGVNLKKIDRNIILLLAERMKLAKQVEKCKNLHDHQPILRFEIEKQRLDQVKKWAEEKDLNPIFAQSIFYMIISESCRVQINQLEMGTKSESKLS